MLLVQRHHVLAPRSEPQLVQLSSRESILLDWCDFKHQMPATEESNTTAMTTAQHTLFFVSRFADSRSLQELDIWDCPALRCLPDTGLPTSLQRLQILWCPALQCLPDSGLSSSLSDLNIYGCPLLEKRC